MRELFREIKLLTSSRQIASLVRPAPLYTIHAHSDGSIGSSAYPFSPPV